MLFFDPSFCSLLKTGIYKLQPHWPLIFCIPVILCCECRGAYEMHVDLHR